MAITTLQQSPHQYRLQYDAATTMAALLDAAQAVLLLLGWSLHDAAAGVSLRAFTAPNLPDRLGAASVKTIVLDGSDASYLRLRVYESWDAVAHTGGNLAVNHLTSGDSYSSYSQRLSLTNGGYLYLNGSLRHLALHSYQSGSWGSVGYGGACGIWEVIRDNSADLVSLGVPPYIWANLGRLMGGTSYGAAFPRLKSGDVGQAAHDNTFIMAPPWGGVGKLPGGTALVGTQLMPGSVDAWSALPPAASMLVGSYLGPEVRGRICGLHALQTGGAPGAEFTSELAFAPMLDPSTGLPLTDGVSQWLDPAGDVTPVWIWRDRNTPAGAFALPW